MRGTGIGACARDEGIGADTGHRAIGAAGGIRPRAARSLLALTFAASAACSPAGTAAAQTADSVAVPAAAPAPRPPEPPPSSPPPATRAGSSSPSDGTLLAPVTIEAPAAKKRPQPLRPAKAPAAIVPRARPVTRVATRQAPLVASPAPAATPQRASDRARQTLDSTALIGAPPPAYAGGQVATGGQLGLLGNRDFLSTPFNETSYTSKYVEDTQAQTLSDVLQSDPAVRDAGLGRFYDTLVIRGFAISANDVSYGGVYGVLPYFSIPPELAERIEVLKGPSALLNGLTPGAGIGGTINVVPKRAADEPLTRITTTYVSNSQFGTAVDVGRRFGFDNVVGVRLNGVYRNGALALDNSKQEFGLGVIGLDYRGDRLRASADFGHQANRLSSTENEVFLNPGFPVPTAPKATTNFQEPYETNRAYDTFGVMRAEYDITKDLTLSGSYGVRRFNLVNFDSNVYINDQFGNASLAREYYPENNDSSSAQVGLRGKVITGPIKHDVSVSLADLHQLRRANAINLDTLDTNIYQPVFYPKPDVAGLFDGDYTKLPKFSTLGLRSVGFADIASILDDRVQLIAGARQQNVITNNFDQDTQAVVSQYDKSRLSPAFALLVKPIPILSVYGNYIEGLAPGATAPQGTANFGTVFPPVVSRQVEAGVKLDLKTVGGSVSAFQIEQPNTFTDPATNLFSQSGRQRDRGIEVFVFGEPIIGFRPLGGLTINDARLTRTAGGTQDGNFAPGVPRLQVNLGAEVDVPTVKGLSLNGRFVYTSFQFASDDNIQYIPAWTRYDLGARYVTAGYNGKPATFRLNVVNLADKAYFASAQNGGNFLTRGYPRTFLASSTFDF